MGALLDDGSLLGWRLASSSPQAPIAMPAAAMTALATVAVSQRRICRRRG
jgi:hypothetical protein